MYIFVRRVCVLCFRDLGWDEVVRCVERVQKVGSVAAAATAILWEHVECGFFCFCLLYFFFELFLSHHLFVYRTYDTPPLTYYIRRYCYSPLVSWFIIIDIAEPSPTREQMQCTYRLWVGMSLLLPATYNPTKPYICLLLHC